MTAPIEPGHVMSREKYEALQVKWLQEKIQSEMISLSLCDKFPPVRCVPYFSFSIPIERNLVEEHRLHKHVSAKGENSASPP